MTRTGKIIRLVSKPRGFVLYVPPDPGPPPVPALEVTYQCDSDDLLVAATGAAKGIDVTVEGDAPICAGVALNLTP